MRLYKQTLNNNICAIQVKEFDEKNNTTGTDFIHSIIEKQFLEKKETLPDWLKAYKNNEIKVSCCFGEHLLRKYPYSPIGLVEAPKSAIYGALYYGFPDESPNNLLWLAVFNLSSLNYEKCKELVNRDIYLFPDLSKDGKCYELWSKKATELQNQIKGTRFIVSDLLENNANENDRTKGKDIADFVIKQDWRKFRKLMKE